MEKSFQEKVQSMTGKEIIMAMVNGLLKGYYKVDMTTFGSVKDNICYGCAATHCITEISGVVFQANNIYCQDRIKALDCDYMFLNAFESAINYLRLGDINGYNAMLDDFDLNIATLKNPLDKLPSLTTANWKNNIQAYIDYANSLN